VERQALLAGFAVQRIVRDYGIDLFLATFDESGNIENGEIRIQLKATDAPRWVKDGQFLAVRVDPRDFRHWLMEPMPVILAVYDAANEQAYWLYVQGFFENARGKRLESGEARRSVRLPRTNIVNPSSMRQFAEFRNEILAQIEGIKRHG
jgi:hypothetical protein